jgi:AraC family transcriptional regulator
MDYIAHIEQALQYVENNLKAEFCPSDLAKAAGYSEYHFLRVFKQVTSLTPADYIRKRRLSEIAREIDGSNRPISDIAFEYGFNSKENFTRAFKQEHNCLPTEYRTSGNSLQLFDRLRLDVVPFNVEPKLVTLEGFSLTVFPGCMGEQFAKRTTSPSKEETIPKFWNMYNCKKLSLRLSDGEVVADYGVSHWNNEKMSVDYFIGIQTNQAKGDIAGTIQVEIPSGLYAMFTTPPSSHFDFVNTVHRTWRFINEVWFPQSGYHRAEGYEFETYIESSRTYSEDIYIPIQKTVR